MSQLLDSFTAASVRKNSVDALQAATGARNSSSM
jgi:hypothetical protein